MARKKTNEGLWTAGAALAAVGLGAYYLRRTKDTKAHAVKVEPGEQSPHGGLPVTAAAAFGSGGALRFRIPLGTAGRLTLPLRANEGFDMTEPDPSLVTLYAVSGQADESVQLIYMEGIGVGETSFEVVKMNFDTNAVLGTLRLRIEVME